VLSVEIPERKVKKMSKRLWMLPVLVAVVVVAGSGTCLAIPSLGGPTGVVSTPTAAIAPQGELQAAVSYQSLEVGAASAYEAAEDFSVWSLQALAGITEQAELWAAYSSLRDGENTSLWGFGGKLQLTAEPADDATLAVGASYGVFKDYVTSISMYGGPATSVTTDAKIRNAYIVATKDLSPLSAEGWEWGPGAGTRMLGSVGLMYISLDPDEGSGESLTRPFVNLEFIGAGGTALGLEYRWKDNNMDDKAVFSAVLRHALSPRVTSEVGTTNAAPGGTGLSDQDWFLRMAVTMPFGQGGL
jgi:hypothetical protein